MRMFCVSFVAVMASVAGTALASPVIDSAKINARIFNDTPGSTLAVTNNYPTVVQFDETGVTNGVNRHNFRLSANGGVTNAPFDNADGFMFSADVTITGTGVAEAGLNVSPWWDPNVSGAFLIKTNGEIAAFDARLPFYSFTVSQGLTYTTGQTVRLGVHYDPAGLSAANPGRIQYSYNGFLSPWLTFSEGNPAEAALHGLWGTLTSAYVGGYVQHNGDNVATFGNMTYGIPAPGALGLLALGGLVATRRRNR